MLEGVSPDHDVGHILILPELLPLEREVLVVHDLVQFDEVLRAEQRDVRVGEVLYRENHDDVLVGDDP